MGSSIGAAWLKPTSIEAQLFANRDGQRKKIEGILEDLFRSHNRRARIVVYGDRGIGKSILTSVASQNFAKQHAERVIRVEVNGRSIGFRQFLKSFASGLVDSTKALLPTLGPKEQAFARWMEELALLAKNDQISEGQINTLTARYGIGAQVSGSLFGVLSGSSSFSWEESRARSGTTSRVQNVTDDLLHAALQATLRQINQETPLFVVVFLDDLDQAYTDDVNSMKPALKRILDVDPCIALVHVRTEMLFDDLRRETDESIEVGPLDQTGLLAIIDRRLDAATTEDKNRFRRPEIQTALRELTRATGNPLVFLRWVHAYLRTEHWPPASETSWTEDAVLLEVAEHASNSAGIEGELLSRLAIIVDRCLPRGRREVQKEDVLRGSLKMDIPGDGKAITVDEFDLLVRSGLLIPKDRFSEAAGYRMDPVLDILRPSTVAKLRSP
jgi:Cdc6-like AAA superfamily ATPase